jgi:hypothetical protein
MKTHRLVLVGLLAFSLAACSSPSRKDETTTEGAPDNRGIHDIAPEGRIIEESGTNKVDPSLPVMTVDSPPILLTPIQGDATSPFTPDSVSAQNWQTFNSSTLGVAVDYPLDWSVADETDGATFTSPQGGTILLRVVQTNRENNETRIGNRACRSQTNSYGLTADICVDHASFSYTAEFTLQLTDGSTGWLMLTTKTRTTGDIFEGMFNSVRLVK